MSKKIIAIGGGEFPRKRSNGDITLYEIKEIHREIVFIAGKDRPNILILNHALENDEFELNGFNFLKQCFEQNFSCNCKALLKSELNDKNRVNELIEWADIIYENGGDTEFLIDLWKKTDFANKIIEAYNNEKVISGVSAGAICLFNCGNSDKYLNQQLNKIDGLNIIDVYFCPHYNNFGKIESVKSSLKILDKVGISLTNSCAIEIIDDNYRLIKGDGSNYNIEPFGIVSYWYNNEYIQKKIDDSLEFKSFSQLLKVNNFKML